MKEESKSQSGNINPLTDEGLIASFKILHEYLGAKLKKEELFKSTGRMSPDTATHSSCSTDGTDDGDEQH